MKQKTKFPAVLYPLAMVLVAGSLMSACGKKAESPAAEKIDKEAVAAVMGAGGGMQSGVTDVGRTDGALQIKYHLYIPEQRDFDEMIGTDLTPKIQHLYKAFNTIDPVTIVVETSDAASPYASQPYCAIDLTRKIYEQTNWTTLLAKDLFKVCKVTYLIREMKK